MKEFRLSDISIFCVLKDLLVNFWVVVLLALVAVMGTDVVLTNLYKPEFTSSATFYVSTKSSSNSAYYDLDKANQMANVLSEVFTSDIMEAKAAEALGMSSLPAAVTATVAENTNLLVLTARAPSPGVAFRAVKAVMDNHNKVSSFVFDNAVIEILDPPSVPVFPSNYVELRPAQVKAAAVGAFLAIALIVVLSVLRDTVKTEESLKRNLDTRLFASLRYITRHRMLSHLLKGRRAERAVLVTDPQVPFAYAETMERVCSRIEYVGDHRGHIAYLVTSARDGEGKSTVSANIALGLARRGHRVLLIDADLRKPSLCKVLKLQAEAFKDYGKQLREGEPPEDAIFHYEKAGLYLLLNRHGRTDSADLISSPRMRELMENCRRTMDYIIVDSPPMSMVSDTEVMVGLCDASLLVVRQDVSFVRTLNDTIDKLRARDLLGCVFNAVREIRSQAGVEKKIYGHYYKKA